MSELELAQLAIRTRQRPAASAEEKGGFARIPRFQLRGAARSATQNKEQEKTLDSAARFIDALHTYRLECAPLLA